MEWTQERIESIRHLFPKQRENVEIDYICFFQALQYNAENGCKWRACLSSKGKKVWHASGGASEE
jgi:hypothetical protein